MPVQGPEALTLAGPHQHGPPAHPLPRASVARTSDLNLNPLASSPQYATAAMGQSSSSESKGLKRAAPYMRGAANSFGFRRTKGSSGANNNDKASLEKRDYSQEALAKEQHNVTTAIKASPAMARAAQDAAAAPPPGAPAPRTNRFGFRNPVANKPAGLSNKVSDSSAQVLAKQKQPQQGLPQSRAQTSPAGPGGMGRPVSSPGHLQQNKKPSPTARPTGPGRPSPPNTLAVTRHGPARPASSFLPRPGPGRPLGAQLARLGAKEAKTVANLGTRGRAPIATFDDELGSSKDSSMNEDSGLGSAAVGDSDTLHGVDLLDVSPRGPGARLRRAHQQQHRRSLRDEDDDPNVITEIVPIAKMVSRASLRSIASLGAQNPSPLPLSARGSSKSVSAKSVSSDEFHTDSSLFRDYGEGLDDSTEAKVYIDCKTAEKRRSLSGRFMKDYGPGEEHDEDWGQGEAMAEGEWQAEVGGVLVIDEEVCGEVRDLRTSLGPTVAAAVEGPKLADLVADLGATGGLIEDESAPEDSLFSSSASSSGPEDSPSPAKRAAGAGAGAGAAEGRRKVRTKKKDREQAKVEARDEAKTSTKAPERPTSGDKKEGHTLSPEGSGTPSNSFSLSDGRDFLIDDEIIDQPALTVHHKLHADDSELASITESAASLTLRDSSHHQALAGGLARARALRRGGSQAEGSPSLGRDNTLRLARFGSMDSLATNSIGSEDLMMDFEDDADSGKRVRAGIGSWAGSPVATVKKSRSFSFVEMDLQSLPAPALARSYSGQEAAAAAARARARSKSVGGVAEDAGADLDGPLRDGVDSLQADNDSVLLELSSLIESISGKERTKDRMSSSLLARQVQAQPRALSQVQLCGGGGGSSGPSSAPDSPRYSLGSSGVPSPLRPPRQLASSDSDESAMMRVDRGTYQHMYQDVVHIKTMLLKLKRVLQEAETLNPFESSLKNGLLHQLVHADESGDDDGKTRNPGEEVVDLKRQMVLMKQQMEEKDRTIQLMQLQMMKYERVSEDSGENGQPADMCNAATQTERIRPVSAGPSLLQSLPSDANGAPLVSWTDTWGRRSRTPASGGNGSPVIESRTSSTSRVPTITSRNSRSIGPGRLGIGTSGDSPSSIPLVKGNHRKTGSTIDTVPNTRRPPVVAAPRKAISSSNQKP